MTTEHDAAKRAERAAAVVDSLHWERIQLVVCLRPIGGSLDPARLRLEPPSGPASAHGDPSPMPPTHLDADPRGIRARFNVMLGPGQAPLMRGRWVLAHDGVPLTVTPGTGVHVGSHARRFAYTGGCYRVRPALDADGALALRVNHRRARRPPLAWHRRVLRTVMRKLRPRRRAFAVLLAIARATVRRNGRRVLFTSDSNAELAGNLKVVHDRMRDRRLDREYRLSMLFKPSVAARRGWWDRLRLPFLLGAADVVLLDDYQPIIYRFRPDPDQRIVQLWHASGAFKTVGYSRIGKPGGPSPFSRRHKNYTHAIVSSTYDVPFYAEAFGIPEERVIPTGIPRMDSFFDPDRRARGRAAAYRALPAIEGRQVILFAPTFRGTGPRDAWYDYARLDLAALHAVCAARDAAVILKKHPFVADDFPIPDAFRDRLIDGSRSRIDVNELLFAVDVLITDYSSIVFEYSTLGRPMLFFAYDLAEYVASRDFYVPFEEFVPGRIARTFAEVVQAIRDDDYEFAKVAPFARRHFDHLDGRATDRVIDQLVLGR